jgi:hypothetical protein
MNNTTIYKNTILYRAALTCEHEPTCRMCNDTGKIGVYFSFNHPQLSEMMTIEYCKDLIVSIYKLTNDIKVEVGKYSFRHDYDCYDLEYNYLNTSHVAYNIIPLTSVNKNYFFKSYELFLTKDKLKYVEYIGNYKLSKYECYKKYRLDDIDNLIY